MIRRGSRLSLNPRNGAPSGYIAELSGTLAHRPWMPRCTGTTSASAADTGITRPLVTVCRHSHVLHSLRSLTDPSTLRAGVKPAHTASRTAAFQITKTCVQVERLMTDTPGSSYGKMVVLGVRP